MPITPNIRAGLGIFALLHLGSLAWVASVMAPIEVTALCLLVVCCVTVAIATKKLALAARYFMAATCILGAGILALLIVIGFMTATPVYWGGHVLYVLNALIFAVAAWRLVRFKPNVA